MADTSHKQFVGQNRLHRNQGVCLYLGVLSRSAFTNFPKVAQVFQLSWTEFFLFWGNCERLSKVTTLKLW
jgi:hypothetical protein